MRHKPAPSAAPTFPEAHIVTFAVTVISGAISALALGHHVESDLAWSGWTKDTAVILAVLFAFVTAMTPISLARAHGESQEGGNAQAALLVIVLMLMIVDGALQVHAVQYMAKSMQLPPLNLWVLIGLASVWQLSLFFVRGALYASVKETQNLIDARAHEREMAAVYAREAELAKRRQRYHENKAGLHLV